MRVLCLVLVCCCWKAVPGQCIISPGVSEGIDWSFPLEAQTSSGGGYFQMGGTSPTVSIPTDLDELLSCYGVTFTWADLNPAQGTYDFSQVSNALAVAADNGKCLVARLKNHVVDRQTQWGAGDVPFIPQWVLDKHNPSQFYVSGDGQSETYIKVAVPWDDGVTTEYLEFVARFGAQDFLSDPFFAGLYVHGVSESAGEEMWLGEEGAANGVAAGMTQENMQSAYGQRLEAWALAAGTNKNKLAWVGMNSFDLPEDNYYLETRQYLNNLAASLGLGIRSGGNEHYNSAFFDQWGLSYDAAKQKLIVDPEWGYRDYNRYLGGEDEQYVDDPVYDPAFTSTIWVEALIGASHIWLPEEDLNDFIRRNRAILQWYAYRAGKPLAQAPDAAIWLRESYFSDGVDCNRVVNFELGLYQIYGYGKNTLPADLYDRSAMSGGIFSHDCTDMHYDYLSRKTDVATGNTQIAIAIDAGFQDSLGNLAVIKVSYQDTSAAAWQIITPTFSTMPIQNVGDGTMKTATFTINTWHLASQFRDGAHFRVVVTNSADLTVRFIRLIRIDG